MRQRPEHSPSIAELLEHCAVIRTKFLDKIVEISQADSGKIYPVDLIAQLAVKRGVNTNSGFRDVVLSHNMLCARVLLRTHIDTALRFYAISLVDNPNDLARLVFSGEHIRRLKDRSGQKMTDAYLEQILIIRHHSQQL